MAKKQTQYLCNQCGSSFPKWMGKCPDCGAWNSLESFTVDRSAETDTHRGTAAGFVDEQAPKAMLIEQINEDTQNAPRLSTGLSEFDRVLGGTTTTTASPASASHSGNTTGHQNTESPTSNQGIVPGSAVLIGGDPGIGKSTLLLQAAGQLAQNGQSVLYVTSEESAQQLKLRADRLYGQANPPIQTNGNLHVLADTNLARIIEQTRQIKPQVVVIDSIQMIYKSDIPAAPGSVTQLRTCSLELIYFAKSTDTALLLVGHVTKQGTLAGPRLLEHMVDTVLYFEGDRYHAHRVVRGIKNRFGTTLEVGLFEMSDSGLKQVDSAHSLLATEYQSRPGSVVAPVFQGSRCLLVEIQALVATGILGAAKRKVSKLDSNRLAVLIAVLEKHAGLRLADQDVFVSSVGGIKIVEPAADLALLLSIGSAYCNQAFPQGTCAIGEVGLGGEIRRVAQIEQRIREASRLGFKRVLTAKGVEGPQDIQVIEVNDVESALDQLGG